jgi:hypothetical protein
MIHTRDWSVHLQLTESDGQTHAQAVLDSGVTRQLRGHGMARKSPVDVDVPEIGDELAAARALADLAHQLLEAAAGDIEAVTHAPARLNS